MKTLLAVLLLAAVPAAAGTLIVNANGYTLDGAAELKRFAALRIGDDGRVAATFPARPPGLPGETLVDARGRTLIPGLIDAHGHVMALGEAALSVDLSGTRSLAEAQALVRAYARANPQARWILGRGWNQELWGLGRFPTAAELDAAEATRPVWLARVDGHAGWANSAAIRAAGVTAATPDPAGGRIERGPGGAPAGVFVDAGGALVAKSVPPPTSEELDRALSRSLEILASVGLTGVGDAGITAGDWARYRRFADGGRMTVRLYAMAGGMEALTAIAPTGPIHWGEGDRLAMMSVKLYADGALGSRGACLKADYSDAPGNRGLCFYTPERLSADIASAAARGFQVNVHAIGDAANAEVLDAFAALTTSRALRLRIEHAQVVSIADLRRFAGLEVIASMQPTHATSDKAMAEARVGPERLAGAYAWKTLIASGARFAGGSDFPVESPNPFFGLHAAVTRQDGAGEPPGGWRPREALTRLEAFAAFTTGAAFANHAEGFAGTLAPGKWADFILIDRDIFTVPAAEIRGARVEATWLAGKPVYRAP